MGVSSSRESVSILIITLVFPLWIERERTFFHTGSPILYPRGTWDGIFCDTIYHHRHVMCIIEISRDSGGNCWVAGLGGWSGLLSFFFVWLALGQGSQRNSWLIIHLTRWQARYYFCHSTDDFDLLIRYHQVQLLHNSPKIVNRMSRIEWSQE